MPDLAPQFARIFDWESIIEYLEYACKIPMRRESEKKEDPLMHVGIRGDGPTMRLSPKVVLSNPHGVFTFDRGSTSRKPPGDLS